LIGSSGRLEEPVAQTLPRIAPLKRLFVCALEAEEN
jgi:hypothetical protein